MQQIIMLFILVAGAAFIAFAATVVMAGTVQLTSRRTHGYLHLIFYAMLFMVALGTLLSSRDLSIASFSLEEAVAVPRNPIIRWSQPLVSLLMLTVAGERIISFWFKREKASFASPVLLVAFVFFWLCSVAAPAFLGAHSFITHDYADPLVIGVAAILATSVERDLAFRAARDALMVFMVAGLLLIPLQPSLVIETSYAQGLLPGVPRLAGLAAHAVSLSVLALLGLISLMALPYRQVWLNRLAWAVGLTVLFLAQSKTAWISFFLCLACFLVVRKGGDFWRRAGNPARPEVGITAILGLMTAVLVVGLVLMFANPGTRIDAFFNSSEGAQLASFTGRDKIWAIAYDEWRRNPVFGYGPLIWETDFRISIGMPNATHAHNQFMDTLSRSGSVGAVSLVFYGLVLMFLSVRYAKESKGLTLALFVLLAMRSISEVPLSLFGYGPEFITHLLLLIALAAVASEVRLRKAQPARGQPSFGFSQNLYPAKNSFGAAGSRL